MSIACVIVALSLLVASPASAQTRMNLAGFYVGAHAGTGFNTPAFDMDEHGPSLYNNPSFGSGDVSGGFNLGGQFGYKRQLPYKLVAGGEFAFGKLGYSGQLLLGPNDDTLHETRGGMYWTALGRIGYALNEKATPYFSIGFIGATNNVSVFDDCVASPCGPLTVNVHGSGMADTWVWGFGFEYDLPMRAMNKRWSLDVGFLFPDFRTNVILEDNNDHSWHFNTHIPQGQLRFAINMQLGK